VTTNKEKQTHFLLTLITYKCVIIVWFTPAVCFSSDKPQHEMVSPFV